MENEITAKCPFKFNSTTLDKNGECGIYSCICIKDDCALFMPELNKCSIVAIAYRLNCTKDEIC